MIADVFDPEAQVPVDELSPQQAQGAPPVDKHGHLHRGLGPRQVQMIAISGTIGLGLFLGTGLSLAEGGPASMLICYTVVGIIVYVTLLLLGEMATQYPVAGSFNAYATRFISPAYGFALSWNYWFNDAVSLASDLTAAQLVLQFWDVDKTWVISLAFWVFLVAVNAIHVRAYGELEYWLSVLKVLTIIVFILLGLCVNLGANTEHKYIGFYNWRIPGAPFVGGFGGFAKVFVTASFAYGGTESLGLTAGETRNPSRNMPRVVKLVFWRCVVPWDYPNLSNESATTSPFTLVFKQAGSNAAASVINAVILTSALSAGNHALFAGTRVLYSLAVAKPRQAPRIFAWTTEKGVPIPALIATSSVSVLSFGSSFIGSGEVWTWLQNIIGVSNQLAWLSIGLSSWRFRKAWRQQGRPPSELKYTARWTGGWGPWFVVRMSLGFPSHFCFQGWSSVYPRFVAVDFVSMYLEIPVMLVMWFLWVLRGVYFHEDVQSPDEESSGDADESEAGKVTTIGGRVRSLRGRISRSWGIGTVNTKTVDLRRDEHEEQLEDKQDDLRAARRTGLLWKLYYWIV
ncbi:hypothetical protein FISHEDRAFT_68148 [Fistulina hepatica ATCC 64428]|uniref:Amino acid permease/ SLC12A domain-containing protein n=1 Tax=Fistulina hepatica ATCC 64428 TaxID=1128425 RepID=A0A0D7A0K0_9AGAR|nr:hypothetical protein FISHEDRAFT_68148 [Fistulina hepatica ATCC 64428]